MPTIPSYEAKRNIVASPVAPARNEVSAPFENQQKVLGAIHDVAQKWSDAHDLMQASEARAKYNTAINDIQSRADLDPDYKNSAPYYKEVEKAKETSLSGIDNQQVKNNLSVEFGYDEGVANLKLQNSFKRKEIDYTRGVIIPEAMEGYQKNMADANSDKEYQEYKQRMDSEIDAHANRMIISKSEAYKLKKEGVFGAAENAIYSNPERAIALIDAGRFNLNEKEIGILKDRATDIISRNEKIAKELQKNIYIKNESQIAMDLASGNPLDIPRLSNMTRANLISHDFLTAAIQLNDSPDSVGAETKNPEFETMTNELFSANNQEEIKDMVIRIMRGGADGKISKDDMAVLIKSAYAHGQAISKNKMDVGYSAVKTLGEWADKTEDKVSRADVFRDFQKKISEGKSPQKAVEETISENTVAKVRPDIISNPANGKIMVDKNGNKARVFPDGRIEEIK